MSSIFDSEVWNLRMQSTTYVSPSLLKFMADAAHNKPKDKYAEDEVILRVGYRPDVASRLWWKLDWTAEDGRRHCGSAQRVDLCAWRALPPHKEVAYKVEVEERPA